MASSLHLSRHLATRCPQAWTPVRAQPTFCGNGKRRGQYAYGKREEKWDDIAVNMIDKFMGSGSTPPQATNQRQLPPAFQGVGNGVILLILINYGVYFLGKYAAVPLFASFPLNAWKYQWWQLITYAFCHADFNHLAGNMFMLLTFGRTVEEEEGAFGLIVTYLICSIGAAAAFLATASPRAALVGASGSVFGLLVVTGVGGNVSYIAHLGGSAAGLILVLILSLLPSDKQ